MLLRTFVSVVAAVLVASVVALGPAPPAGAAPSQGCGVVNEPPFDGPYAAATFPDALTFAAGDQLTLTATDPTQGAASFSLEVPTGSTVSSTAIPGTITYTFPADVSTTLYWSVDVGLASWTVSCTPAATPTADLSLAKSCTAAAGPGQPATLGSRVTCAVTVTNLGQADATSIAIEDDLPDGVTLVSIVPTGVSCLLRDPILCTLNFPLAPQESFTLRYTVRVDADVPAGAELMNTASVSTLSPEGGPGPNTATATITVAPCTITGAGVVVGTPGDDVLCGSAGADRLYGAGGDDTLYGLGGDDQLAGGDGDDVLVGGTGADRLAGDAGDDHLNGVDGAGGDLLLGGSHVAFDRCSLDTGDLQLQCEAS